MKHLVKINIETKKNNFQQVTFLIEYAIFYPSIGNGFWRNVETLKEEYWIVQVVNDFNADCLEWDRNNQPGLRTHVYDEHGERTVKYVPGEIVYKNKKMGEIDIKAYRHYSGDLMMHFGYGNNYTKGENDLFEAQIFPVLKEYINTHKEELRNEAIERLRKDIVKKLNDYKNDYEKLEREGLEIVKNLKSK